MAWSDNLCKLARCVIYETTELQQVRDSAMYLHSYPQTRIVGTGYSERAVCRADYAGHRLNWRARITLSAWAIVYARGIRMRVKSCDGFFRWHTTQDEISNGAPKACRSSTRVPYSGRGYRSSRASWFVFGVPDI